MSIIRFPYAFRTDISREKEMKMSTANDMRDIVFTDREGLSASVPKARENDYFCEIRDASLDIIASFLESVGDQELDDWFSTYWDAYGSKAISVAAYDVDGGENKNFEMRVADPITEDEDYDSTCLMYSGPFSESDAFWIASDMTKLMNELIDRTR